MKKAASCKDFRTPTELPPHFFERLHFLELEMEGPSPQANKISKLVELYATAIEFFNSRKDDRYSLYITKMKRLWHRDNIQRKLFNSVKKLSSPPLSSPSAQKENTNPNLLNNLDTSYLSSHSNTNSNPKLHTPNPSKFIPLLSSNSNSSSTSKQFLANHTKSSKKRKSLIESEINSQKKRLSERLEQKRKSLGEIKNR